MSHNSPKRFAEYLAEQGKTLADIAPQSRTRLVVAGRLTRRDTPTTPPPPGEGIAMKQRAHRLRLLAAQIIREARELEDAAERQL